MSEEAKNTVPETEQPETAPEEKTAAAAPGCCRGCRYRRGQEEGRRLVQQEGPGAGSR